MKLAVATKRASTARLHGSCDWSRLVAASYFVGSPAGVNGTRPITALTRRGFDITLRISNSGLATQCDNELAALS